MRRKKPRPIKMQTPPPAEHQIQARVAISDEQLIAKAQVVLDRLNTLTDKLAQFADQLFLDNHVPPGAQMQVMDLLRIKYQSSIYAQTSAMQTLAHEAQQGQGIIIPR